MSSSQSKEVSFLRISGNHQEFAGKLRHLEIPDGRILGAAKDVATKWFRLAQEHLADAQNAHRGKSHRSAYSRAYYAAYNASKAVRYMTKGVVSLHGDDHAKASELPDDFEDLAKWSRTVTDLYADRLRADYDNWDDTLASFGRPAADAVGLAEKFLDAARRFLMTKHGLHL